MSSDWDEMRRKARLLENEIDSKLVSLNKINSSGAVNFNADHSRVVNKRAVFESLSSDVENLISKLTKLNNDMTDYVEMNKSQHNGPALHHTVRRHREILRDYGTEFNRACTNIKNQLEREDLLSGGSTSDSEFSAINNRAKSSDYLLRENDSINSCDRLVDEHISIAMSVKENLQSQKSGLGDINKRIQHLTRKYPAINNVINKIRVKKRKDTIILAAVISTCLILLFIYVMH
ncbi:golgi SNAP receptor complex member 1 [Ditylenchus destructor]|uniref:Golgi SNAP receptor complex member 1 n=1 Tax=Ditylenchus destructor TaxID=166010 RepID=A0AAD4NJC0_9BILA|nr:golgi SNAP receptor complex member 1 [Ditylenchus destructor]